MLSYGTEVQFLFEPTAIFVTDPHNLSKSESHRWGDIN